MREYLILMSVSAPVAARGRHIKESFQGKSEVVGRRKVSTVTRIKLDDNFEINVLGGEENLERGYDKERGMRYYTLYFERER